MRNWKCKTGLSLIIIKEAVTLHYIENWNVADLTRIINGTPILYVFPALLIAHFYTYVSLHLQH
jgi:hypothetical protein